MVWENVVAMILTVKEVIIIMVMADMENIIITCIKAFTSNNVDLGDVLEGYTLSMDGKLISIST
ncbi:MAG: hypothetical protein ACLS9K_03755 [Lachnospira eligens]